MAARPALPWPSVALVLLALPLTFVAPWLLPGVGTWWPASGVVAAALLLAARTWRLPLLVLTTVVASPLAAVIYDAGPVGAVAASLAVLLPALVLEVGLRPVEAARDRHGPVRDFGGWRYHLVVLASAVVCGATAGLLSLMALAPAQAALWAVSTFLGGLTSALLVLPLVAGSSGTRATGLQVELVAQRLLVLALAVVVVVGGSRTSALAVGAFPLLGWAALRASRREAHVQVFGFGLAAYLSTTYAAQLGNAPVLLDLPDALTTLPLYLFLASLGLFTVPLALATERLSQARAEAERNADTMVRMLESATSTLFILTDDRGRITQFNEGAQRVLGYTAEQAVGRFPAIFWSDDEVRSHARALGTAHDATDVMLRQVELGEPRDWVCTTADGSERVVSLSVTAITDQRGATVGYLGAGTDVTERERTQHLLEGALEREHEAVVRLREVDDVKQELISNVSHELRTPITSIAGYAELLADNSLGDLTRQQRDALVRIERNAVRLQSLVDDLLTMSRAEAGRLQLSRTPLDLVDVVRGAWELFEAQLRHRALETSMVVPPTPVPVVGDAAALERVVVNLVSNAVKFTPDGGSVDVAVARAADGTARLTVRDSGIGIDADDQARLFTRFFRAREATDQAIQGTGLGLSIVQALVSQHGGRVSVRSQPGAGTRVTVELPPA